MECENNSVFDISGKDYSDILNCKNTKKSIDGKSDRYVVEKSYGGDLIIKDLKTGTTMCFFK